MALNSFEKRMTRGFYNALWSEINYLDTSTSIWGGGGGLQRENTITAR